MNILIVSDSIAPEMFGKALIEVLSTNKEAVIHFIYKQKQWSEFDFGQFVDRVNLIYTGELAAQNQGVSRYDVYYELVQLILSDQNTFLFYDRLSLSAKERFGQGMLHYTRYIINVVKNTLDLFSKTDFRLVYFRTTPHSIDEWIIANVAEYLNVQVIITEASLLPWRFFLVSGFKRDRKYLNYTEYDISDKEYIYINEYLETVKGDYEQALPSYEKKRFKKNKGKHFNLKLEILRNLKRPKSIVLKYSLFKAYLNLSNAPNLNLSYVVFFLHFQPERTTLPEGFGFTQQVLALHVLRQALPSEIRIYVKEHPSTFMVKWQSSQRHNSFYKDIDNIENCQLVPLDFNSFKLIDKSLLVATITGSVGREAFIRGKPVVFFGRSFLKIQSGVHHFTSVSQLEKFILNVMNGDSKIIASFESDLNYQLKYTFTSFHKYLDYSSIYNTSVRDQAHISAFKWLVTNSNRVLMANFDNESSNH